MGEDDGSGSGGDGNDKEDEHAVEDDAGEGKRRRRDTLRECARSGVVKTQNVANAPLTFLPFRDRNWYISTEIGPVFLPLDSECPRD